MPDTLTPQELAAIRERDAFHRDHPKTGGQASDDRHDLLAHIDALTAAVEHMPTARIISQWDLVSRKAVLAILRGES